MLCEDKRLGLVCASRDPLGGYPLFWTQTDGAFAASTAIRPLLDFIGNVEADPLFSAEHLSRPGVCFSEPPEECTAYKNVRRLLPGCFLIADPVTGRIRTRQWWRWEQHVPAGRPPSREEAVAAVRETLTAAVRERLNRFGRTAAHLSGGYDSTGVALLAHEELRKRGDSVHAVSMIYEREKMTAVESEYIRAALTPEMHWYRLPADDILDYDNIDRMPATDEPCYASFRFGMAKALTETVQETGADIVLVGHGGDFLFDYPAPVVLGRLLLERRFLRFWKALRAYNLQENVSLPTMLEYTMMMMPGSRIGNFFRALLRSGRAGDDELTAMQVPSWYTSKLADGHKIYSRILANQYPSPLVPMSQLCCLAGDWGEWFVSAPRGVMVDDPYLDPRLVSLVLSIPWEWHTIGRGNKKRLMGDVLTGVLPDKIILRKRKSHFGLLARGFSKNLRALERIVKDAPNDEGFIDRTKLLCAMRRFAVGVDTMPGGLFTWIPAAISYLHWLGQRDAWRDRDPRHAPLFQKTEGS